MFRKRVNINKRHQLMEESISKEQIRMIQVNIDQKLDCHSTSFMLTSPTDDGEKSIISSKLAISFAEQGKKVLLVDANLRNPSIHNWFQLTNQSGLTNVIVKEEDIQHHIKETLFPGLFVLPTGPNPLNLSDLWVTSKIKGLVRKVQLEYDVVIFEAPPFLNVSDSQILANQCDGVILVVKANKTKKADVLKTKDYLEKTSNSILGVIYQTG
ncbi:CpsD/CapB family tyrosine-protein kinase [Neobacillus drentensis]|uniref:CpsD/CapB family tyrosine-protein kinase n=1 Tax=Neobacillus drentensis TaxID=220684 RepID=UPI002FFF278F